MVSSTILAIFLTVFTLYLLFEALLVLLNLTRLKAHEGRIPEFAQGHIDQETYEKACSYSKIRARFALVSLVYSNFFFLAFLLLGGFGALDTGLRGLAQSCGMGERATGVAYIVLVSTLFSLIDIPLSLYGTFRIEERFGFNRMSLRLWVYDRLKGLLLTVLVMVPLLAGILWCMEYAGEFWWLYAFVLLCLFQLLLVFVLPVLILPLFNKFTPLPEGELLEAIRTLCERAQYRMAGVFCMDGSKRSAHANAFFTGFGATKRIVLFDTLLEKLTPVQTTSVLAHEIGHAKFGHIKKSLCLSLAVTLVGLAVLAWLMQQPELYLAFGFTQPSNYAALVIFALASSPFTYFLSPVFSSLSRRFEYQADHFACEMMGSPTPLVEALFTLSRASLSNLVPHPLYSFFHHSHPTLGERVSAMHRLT